MERDGERQSETQTVPSYEGAIPVTRIPPSLSHLSLTTPKDPSPNTITVGVMASMYEL